MSEMNTISKHVTLAERTLNPNDHPGAKPEMLVPASVVFSKTQTTSQSQRLLPMVDLCSGRQLAPSKN